MESFDCVVVCFVFFFFQAEDGIRDTSVTGVQTCALPILAPRARASRRRPRGRPAQGMQQSHSGKGSPTDAHRSGERRVGKECRSRWWRDHEKKKKKREEKEQRP